MNQKKTTMRVAFRDRLYLFKSMYKLTKLWKKSLVTILLSFFTAIVAVFLIQNTGMYIPGLEAISQGFGRLAYFLMRKNGYSKDTSYLVFTLLFWGINCFFNIPLIIFSWKKISKEFSFLSLLYIVFNSVFAAAFSLIPHIKDVYIFSHLDENLPAAMQQYDFNFVSWTYPNDAYKQLSVFLYMLIWGAYFAINCTILLIVNSSTGGPDFIGVYIAKTKYKDFGTVLTICNLIFFIVGYIMGSYIPVSENIKLHNITEYNVSAYDISLLFSPSMLAAISMSLLFSALLNNLFPKYSLVRAEIYTTKANEIRNHIIEHHKPYTLTIYEATGGYNNQSQTVIVTTCMYLDTDDLLEIIRSYDPNSFFTISKIKKVDGYVYVYKDN
ncbi:Uncharacterized protein conserved in bacteria (DUF2179) [Mycoplasmopsis californica]|uniref:DUF2179 domain-containing protein n=1 Tax=Mycoplasmopsis equigenitalium TaxID=114883 RepID=A0ABY5J5F6_9BACT|nr:DUF2179 domain-containing protein [Mycoplasmopsis equigenitalium]UUD37116.1 DUF2179 domain-containing protein [Mycoplasmopsis equigenitalium]VEU69578.1 Uncharacterized protein conserved in bacteria (DUF2179) [Mycoplasmopsis californica]